MTSDVAKKAVSANGYTNGSSVVFKPGFNSSSTISKLDPTINRTETVDVIEGRYDDRFDDIRYYTGDDDA